MRALRFARTGSLENLGVESIDPPVPGAGEVLVRVQAAAINPSDVKNVLGKMGMTSVPRTPGRDFAGVVEQGPPEWIGRPVFGTGGDLGFRRDGSHAEYLAVPVEAVLVRPDVLGPEQAAALGLAYMTAWAAVVDAAGLRAGEPILITGVTGAVGGAAARIARWRARGSSVRSAKPGSRAPSPTSWWISTSTSKTAPSPSRSCRRRRARVCRSFSMSSAGLCSSRACGAWPTGVGTSPSLARATAGSASTWWTSTTVKGGSTASIRSSSTSPRVRRYSEA